MPQLMPGDVKKMYELVVTEPDSPEAMRTIKNMGITRDEQKSLIDAENIIKSPTTTEEQKKRSVQYKNYIFGKVSDNLPAEELGRFDVGGGFVKQPGGLLPNIVPFAQALGRRVSVKNTISNHPDLQIKYFTDRNFDVRQDENGRVEVRKPGEIGFRPIESDDIDAFDALDIVDDIVIGGLQGAATATKFAGAVAAGTTGGLSIPAAVAGGALVGAAGEIGRQSVGKVLGTRDEFDLSTIAQEAVTGGAIPGAFGALGVLSKGAGKGLNKIIQSIDKPSFQAKEIAESAGRLGLETTPGQMSRSAWVRWISEAQEKGYGFIGPYALKNRNTAQATYDKVATEAEKLVSGRSGLSKNEAGSKAWQLANEIIDIRKKNATDLYNEAKNAPFFRNDPKIDTANLKAEFEAIKKKYKGDPNVKTTFSKFDDELNDLDNLDELWNFISSLGDEVRKQQGAVSAKEGAALNAMRTSAKKSWDENFELFLQKAESGEWKTKPEVIKASRDTKKLADSVYVELHKDLDTLVARPGEQVSGGVSSILEKFANKHTSEKMVDDIFKKGDYDKIDELRKRFPDVYTELKAFKQQELYDRWFTKGVGLDPRKIIADLDDKKLMTKEWKHILFGKNSDEVINDLITVYRSFPKGEVNPSKTAFASEITSADGPLKAVFMIPTSNASSFMRGMLLNFSATSGRQGEDILFNLGQTLQGRKLLKKYDIPMPNLLTTGAIGAQEGQTLLPKEIGPEKIQGQALTGKKYYYPTSIIPRQ